MVVDDGPSGDLDGGPMTTLVPQPTIAPQTTRAPVANRATGAVVTVVAAAGLAVGYAASVMFGTTHVGRMLPWILGRGLGIAAYLCLVALTAAGLWLRHPWRLRWRRPAPQAQLRLHATLAALTLVLLLGHITALVLDRYAGVGVRGAIVAGGASYRPFAVALGTVSVYLGLLVGVSAALAGTLVRRAWLPVHKVASAVFVLTWLHALLAGSDSSRLAWLYVVTGAFLIGLAVTRRLAPAPAPQAVAGR
jgi:sulfoxide reductase heme-binding subunit YedZ